MANDTPAEGGVATVHDTASAILALQSAGYRMALIDRGAPAPQKHGRRVMRSEESVAMMVADCAGMADPRFGVVVGDGRRWVLDIDAATAAQRKAAEEAAVAAVGEPDFALETTKTHGVHYWYTEMPGPVHSNARLQLTLAGCDVDVLRGNTLAFLHPNGGTHAQAMAGFLARGAGEPKSVDALMDVAAPRLPARTRRVVREDAAEAAAAEYSEGRGDRHRSMVRAMLAACRRRAWSGDASLVERLRVSSTAASLAAEGRGREVAEIESWAERAVADIRGRIAGPARGEMANCSPFEIHAGMEGLGMTLRFNEREGRPEYGSGGSWTRLDSGASLRQLMLDAYSVEKEPGEAAFLTSARLVAEANPVDPFLDWVKGCGRRHPMTPAEAQALFEGLPDDLGWTLLGSRGLGVWALRSPFMTAVARALRPGLKMDECTVLMSRTFGTGKGAFCEEMLPEESRMHWHTDSLRLNAAHGRQLEALLGCVFVEIGEMAGSGRADLNTLKQFMSARKDKFRLAWDPSTRVFPRRCAFVATANPDDFALPNVSDNRRFVVVDIEAEKGRGMSRVRAYADANRERVWAAALALVEAGEQLHLPESLFDRQARQNEPHRYRMALEDRFDEWEEEGCQDAVPVDPAAQFGDDDYGRTRPAGFPEHGYAKVDDVCIAMGLDADRNRREILALMKRAGWGRRSVRIDMSVRKRWFPARLL